MVEQCLGFTPILWRCDELPDETLDVLISAIMEQTKDQDDTADCLHVAFTQTALTSGMGQDVPPATPTGHRTKTGNIVRTKDNSTEYELIFEKIISSP